MYKVISLACKRACAAYTKATYGAVGDALSILRNREGLLIFPTCKLNVTCMGTNLTNLAKFGFSLVLDPITDMTFVPVPYTY